MSLHRLKIIHPQAYKSSPWNEKTCTDEGHPSTYLTFSWGDPLPENRIFRALNDAEDNVLEMVDNGFGGYQIPDDWILGVDGARNIRIQVRPYKEHYWSTNKFVVFKSRLAVELLRACGLEKGEFREMWGYVFNLGKMIGYIWLEQGRIVPFGSGNRTAEFLDS